MSVTACASVERSTDALTDARMATQAGVWALTQSHQVPAVPYIFLLLTHQAAPSGMEMGSRGGRERGPGSLGSQVEAILVDFHHPIWDLIYP